MAMKCLAGELGRPLQRATSPALAPTARAPRVAGGQTPLGGSCLISAPFDQYTLTGRQSPELPAMGKVRVLTPDHLFLARSSSLPFAGVKHCCSVVRANESRPGGRLLRCDRYLPLYFGLDLTSASSSSR
jgi:hypothetical protein